MKPTIEIRTMACDPDAGLLILELVGTAPLVIHRMMPRPGCLCCTARKEADHGDN